MMHDTTLLCARKYIRPFIVPVTRPPSVMWYTYLAWLAFWVESSRSTKNETGGGEDTLTGSFS
ncbi:hypothetical protein U9M48_039064 [Paspalum notatum var. saurae]|uniref:Uncharacterized protein n=1 Tax=Paspalum notatum var. saurae TaxID=547442 RepID=A0AAQ3UI50_PASNO